MTPYNATPSRVVLVCSTTGCPRTVKIPVPLFQQDGGDRCDQCGGVMRVVACEAGIDPANGAPVWSDRPLPPIDCERRKTLSSSSL